MMRENLYLAFDFGAESSRAVCGSLENNKLTLKEIYRFNTGMLSLNNHFYWNIYRFYEEMLKAVCICTQKNNIFPQSVAVDTWGVDFGFLAEDDTIVRIPYAYRDLQVIEAMSDFHTRIPPEEIYALTGISMQPFNSLYHLHAMRINNDLALVPAKRLMFMPDLLNFLLSGEKKTEFTFATTSQLYNPFRDGWDKKLLKAVSLDVSWMNDIIQPGTVIGQLKDEICRHTGLKQAAVASVCSHDTGSAIVAVPATGENWAYISSGTWSLMGLELEAPLVNEKAFRYNFSNEGGAERTFRFLKNIMGLWLIQQCQRQWEGSGMKISYPELIEKAGRATPFRTFLDPDYEGFFNPQDMTSAIDGFCRLSAQQKPRDEGEYSRVIFESLALKYRHVLDQLTEVSGKEISTIHVIGGGSRNELLCQFTANATGKKVITGPAEGTAAGNIFMQAVAHGHIGSLGEIREIVKNSFKLNSYYPEDSNIWDNAYRDFLKVLKDP
jgi:rhamnulokinase